MKIFEDFIIAWESYEALNRVDKSIIEVSEEILKDES